MKLIQNLKVLYSAIAVLFIIVVGLGTYSIINLTQENNEENYDELIPFTVLPTLNHEQFKAKFDSGEEFFVYIGRPDCGDSRRFEAAFRNYFVNYDDKGNVFDVKYKLDENLYYFDISEIIDSTSNQAKRAEYNQLYGFHFTPSLVHYKNKEVVRIAEWDPVYDFHMADYMKWFYDTGLINPKTEVYHEGRTDKIIKTE